jgi:hypothetical protein
VDRPNRADRLARDVSRLNDELNPFKSVTPAKAGIQGPAVLRLSWIPAYAGMTISVAWIELQLPHSRRNRGFHLPVAFAGTAIEEFRTGSLS